ncbi:MgtC/SapB family protein [Metabacillus sp. GX 13764]|uniref:MgtC/SapB family protein n=1 Tax=Metabacillus kandeliae TaxID=2900151 RepID=UPI001E3C507A|nr:MgtC/SapB family protein [Metabacillus kandeliae]MCD7032662.1 MgtC/SapB family protein [Metabacillus kandeliae]
MEIFMDHQQALIKLFLSLIVGIIIGMEREIKKKPLGIKTTIIISVTACLLTVVSIEASYALSEKYSRPMDPLRLAAQIVSGVGFLGAGAILRRSNDVISGLTTAAIVWGAAALGISIGAGFYAESLAALILIIVSIDLIAPLIKRFGPKKLNQKEMKTKLQLTENTKVQNVLDAVKNNHLRIKYIRIRDQKEDSVQKVELLLLTAERIQTSDVYLLLKKLEGVQSVEIESVG